MLCAAVSGRPLRTYTNVAVSITRRVRSRITRSTDVGGCRPATGRRSLLLPYAVASVGSHKLAAAVTRGHTMRRRPRCPDRSIDRCEVVVRARRTILIAPFDRRHGPAGLPAASPPRRRRPRSTCRAWAVLAGRASWQIRVGEVWAVHAHCLAENSMAAP